MENNYLKLADIPTGEECVIVKVHGHGSFRNRIVEMGFVRGKSDGDKKCSFTRSDRI